MRWSETGVIIDSATIKLEGGKIFVVFSKKTFFLLVTLDHNVDVWCSKLCDLAAECVQMDNTSAFSNLKIGGLPTLGAESGPKVQKTHFPHQKMSKSVKFCQTGGAGDGISGIQGAIGQKRTSPLSQARKNQGCWGCVMSFLANFPKKSIFWLKCWLIFANFCPQNTPQDPAAGHQGSSHDKQKVASASGAPQKREGCHEMDPRRAKH